MGNAEPHESLPHPHRKQKINPIPRPSRHVQRFRSPMALKSEAGCYFTHLQAAVTFLEGLSVEREGKEEAHLSERCSMRGGHDALPGGIICGVNGK